MATDAALATPELLINILQELDTQTLLLSQRVSKQWHAVILSTPELQENLYFKPRQKKATDKQYLWIPSERKFELWKHQHPLENASSPSNSVKICTSFIGPSLLTQASVNPMFTEELLPLGTNCPAYVAEAA
ncbi:hypothetical protein MBLNU13_g07141t1 [Cladosporium sp. NU13]